jgi:hypothetical protein
MAKRFCQACGSDDVNTTFCNICGRTLPGIIPPGIPPIVDTRVTDQADHFEEPQLTKSFNEAARELSSTRVTRTIHPREILEPSWPLAIAALEQLKGQSDIDYLEAFRLGLLALLTIATRETTQQGTTPDRIVRLRKLVDALAKLPTG